MRRFHRFLNSVGLVAIVLGIGLQPVGEAQTASEPLGAASGKTDALSAKDRLADRAAIAAVGQTFARAFQANDVKAIVSLYAEDGELVDEHGDRVQGRAAIEQMYTALFRDRPGSKIEVKPASLRFLGPDLAREEGRTTVTPAGGEPASTRHYSVVFRRIGTHWLYLSVAEDFDKNVSHHERLEELEWLVGEWVDESSESSIHVRCDWSSDKNFLLREFSVHVHGKAIMTVSQRIGWDPLHKQIKSWFFDSEGGFGESLWNREGASWLIKSTGVLTDGRAATATHVLTRLNATTARWAALDRTTGGRVVAIDQESVLVRKPPHPSAR